MEFLINFFQTIIASIISDFQIITNLETWKNLSVEVYAYLVFGLLISYPFWSALIEDAIDSIRKRNK